MAMRTTHQHRTDFVRPLSSRQTHWMLLVQVCLAGVISLSLLFFVRSVSLFAQNDATIHLAKAGETWASIAALYGMSREELRSYNPAWLECTNENQACGKEPAVGNGILIPGRVNQTVLPSSSVYVVKSGDTLFRIAVRSGNTVASLFAANRNVLATPSSLSIGVRLVIPAQNDFSVIEPGAAQQSTYLDCPADAQLRRTAGSVHNRLYIGGIAVVLPGGGSVSRLYATATYESPISDVPDGSQLYVLDGPRCVKGNSGNYYQRWYVEDLQTARSGWVSEGGRDAAGQVRYWLAPEEMYTACTGYDSRIRNGDTVYMAWGVSLKLRRSPSSSESVVVGRGLPPGKLVQVVGGPECANGWTFWLLNVDGSRYYASEGDPNNANAGYWLVPVAGEFVSQPYEPPLPDYNSPVYFFLAYQNAINDRDFEFAYGSLSDFFRSDLCQRSKVCTVQVFANGYKGREFVATDDIRNERQGKNVNYRVFDATFHPEGTISTSTKTICMLFENEQWKVHGILPLGSKSCG